MSEVAVKDMPMYTIFIDSEDDLCRKVPAENHRGFTQEICRHEDAGFPTAFCWSDTKFAPISREDVWDWVGRVGRHWGFERETIANETLVKWCKDLQVAVEGRKMTFDEMPIGTAYLDTEGDLTFKESDQYALWCDANDGELDTYSHRNLTRYMPLSYDAAVNWIEENSSNWSTNNKQEALALVNRYTVTRPCLIGDVPKFYLSGVKTERTSCLTDKAFCEFWDKCLKILSLQRESVLNGDMVNVYFKPLGEDIFITVDKLTLNAKFVTLINEQNGKYVYCNEDLMALPELKVFKTVTTTVTEKVQLD